MIKKQGTAIIILISLISLSAITCLIWPSLTSIDLITISFIVAILSVFIFGLYISFCQQKLIDYELYENVGTLEKKLLNEIKNLEQINTLEIINSYHKEYISIISKHLHKISSTSSLLVTLGLVGTILGLIISMGSLKSLVVSAGDNDAVLGTMTNVLSGVDVSFYTTLLGSFLGGIILKLNIMVHQTYIKELSSKTKLSWVKNSVSLCTPKETNNLTKELINILYDFNKLHKELGNSIRETDKNLCKFSHSLEYMSTIPIHQKLSTLSETIEKQSSYITKTIQDISKDRQP